MDAKGETCTSGQNQIEIEPWNTTNNTEVRHVGLTKNINHRSPMRKETENIVETRDEAFLKE